MKMKTHATIKAYEGASMYFDLLWNYVAGGVSFCQFIISRTGSEEYASIEINPVDIAGVRLLRLYSEKPENFIL